METIHSREILAHLPNQKQPKKRNFVTSGTYMQWAETKSMEKGQKIIQPQSGNRIKKSTFLLKKLLKLQSCFHGNCVLQYFSTTEEKLRQINVIEIVSCFLTENFKKY